jgi:hypothetical protein
MKQANPPASSVSSSSRTILSRGVARLLKPEQRQEGQPDDQGTQPPHAQRNLTRASLWAADILLFGVSVYIAFGTAEPLSGTRILLCIAALLMGAWLSLLAIRL